MDTTEYLSIGETAERIGTTIEHLRYAERRGAIKALRTIGGHRRFLASDLEQIRQQLFAEGRRYAVEPVEK